MGPARRPANRGLAVSSGRRLNPPAAVRAATEAYLSEQDSLAEWIAECCITGEERWGVGALLWQSWKAWAEANNERPGNRKGFAQAMVTHGYPPEKSQGVRGQAGINLKAGAGSLTDLN